MKYDVLLYDCENIFDAAAPDRSMIRIDGLTQSEMEDLSDIMTQHDISVCLFPVKE